ncbi:hypothetical protein RSAG8_04967, partial [Rhizoctonia solani AG-8 WAC10335]
MSSGEGKKARGWVNEDRARRNPFCGIGKRCFEAQGTDEKRGPMGYLRTSLERLWGERRDYDLIELELEPDEIAPHRRSQNPRGASCGQVVVG